MFFDWQVYFLTTYLGLIVSVGHMDVKDWAAVISIGWVLYQLIEKRRISESNVDSYLESHFTAKSKSVEDQRKRYLAHLDTAASSWALARIVRSCLANLVRGLWYIWRIAKWERDHKSARHAMLLFDGGGAHQAQKEFLKVADSLMDTARTYRKQALLKRNEAINAYIFAGRVAKIEGDSVATLAAFNKAIAIKESDYDAQKFIGEQLREVGDLHEALEEFKKLANMTAARRNSDKAAEAKRLQAGVLIEQGKIEEACAALTESLATETARRDLLGMAVTKELFGDAHRRNGSMKDAAAWYRKAIEDYREGKNHSKVKGIQAVLWRLQPEETFMSRAVTAVGTFLIERVAKQLRAPAQMP